MRKSKLTETVLRALRPSVNEKEEEIEAEEEVEDIEGDEEIKVKDVEKISIEEPEGSLDAGRFAAVQSALIRALDAAQDIGDEKLETQIGNTITFVTRSQVRVDEASVLKENVGGAVEIEFQNWLDEMSTKFEDEKITLQTVIDYAQDTLKDYAMDDWAPGQPLPVDENRSSRYNALAEKVVARIKESKKKLA